MDKLEQKFSVNFTFDVYFTKHLFLIDNPLFKDIIQPLNSNYKPKVAFVIDEGLLNHHPYLSNQIKEYFENNGNGIVLAGEPLVVVGGEEVKNDPQWVEKVLNHINQHKIDRHSYLVAIGGGAVLDMAGFAAAIGHRGIRMIRIPTTVLSQNDSGVGVKNGINAFGKKNFLGTFDPPYAVINDRHFLTTLDDRDWRSGIAEAVKVALIKDKPFFEELEKQVTAFNNRNLEAMTSQIRYCAKLHMEHIASGDPFEKGSSRPLDFGHWAAHKLEQITNYKLRHGEAVAIGMALDVTYSMLVGYLSKTEWERILTLLKALKFEIYVPELVTVSAKGNTMVLMEGLREFREHLGGELTIMLIDEIGYGREVNEIDEELMIRALEILEKEQEKITV